MEIERKYLVNHVPADIHGKFPCHAIDAGLPVHQSRGAASAGRMTAIILTLQRKRPDGQGRI